MALEPTPESLAVVRGTVAGDSISVTAGDSDFTVRLFCGIALSCQPVTPGPVNGGTHE